MKSKTQKIHYVAKKISATLYSCSCRPFWGEGSNLTLVEKQFTTDGHFFKFRKSCVEKQFTTDRKRNVTCKACKKTLHFRYGITAKRFSRQRAWQLKQKSLGFCTKCTKKAISEDHCLYHLKQNRERNRIRSRQLAGIPQDAPLINCGRKRVEERSK